MDLARIILSAVLALLLIATGGGKLVGAASSKQIRDSLHVPPTLWRGIGALEMLAVIGLVAGIWIRPLGIAAAAGVVALMVGAIIVRVRVGGDQRRTGIVGDLVVLVVAVAAIVLSALALG